MAADSSKVEIAIPGKTLGSLNSYIPGPGTHTYGDHIIASQLGYIVITAPKQAGSATAVNPARRLTKIVPAFGPEALPTLSVSRQAGAGGGRRRRQEVLPDVGNVVLCRVTRIMPRQAIVSIQQVRDTVLETEWQGVIRQQDVRATEKDKIKMYESFRPGDLVRAQVVRFTLF
jgi:exosome complex component CSL4